MSLETQPEPTASEKTSAEIRNSVKEAADAISSAYHATLENIFNNPELTAQEAADSLGTDAQDLFSFLGDCKSAVEARTNRVFTPVSDFGSVSNDGDGSVTITLN